MLKLLQPITSINGFKIGDKVRLKDGDGRPHIIKSFSIDGIKEFFFEVQFEDGTETMLNNIALLPSNIDEAAEKYVQERHLLPEAFLVIPTFKAGAEWMAKQLWNSADILPKEGDNIIMIMNENPPLAGEFHKSGYHSDCEQYWGIYDGYCYKEVQLPLKWALVKDPTK